MQESSKDTAKLEKEWKISLKQTEFGIIEPYFRRDNIEGLLKKRIEKNWILETLLEDGKVNILKSCKTLVMVGCGMYPYSLIATNKKYPNIKYIGIDYDIRCVKIVSTIINKGNIPNMDIVHSQGIDYNYSELLDEDLVFISCDVNNAKDIYNKILDTSKAQIFICAPNRVDNLGNYLLGLTSIS